ncbi:MAG: hypothetical protein IJV30_02230 [Oscillospiraceae bacterium]|nr:hypothetical protein [Clostridium sp.]MBQ7436127.1 hypothetical protein [Oscillospiraceae bacterium]
MSWTKPDDRLREQSAMGRFEIMCERYIAGNDMIRQTILSALSSEDQHTFLVGVGLYRLFSDQQYYKAVRDALACQMWRDNHQEP